MELPTAVFRASKLVDQGRHGEAYRLLVAVLGDPPDVTGDDIVAYAALRTLARCRREDGDFDAARAFMTRGLEIAQQLDFDQGVAVALETLATIEVGAGNLRAAALAFDRSAQVEQARGEPALAALALSNYAHMLITEEIEGGQQLLERALAAAPPGSGSHATIADNMGSELERQGRHAEAADWAQRAVEAYRALGDRPRDLYIALRNLARHLRNANRLEEAAATFEEAHELIFRLRRAEVDDAHYAAYARHVEEIEAKAPGLFPEEGGWLAIGAYAMLGEQLLEQGKHQLEEGRHAEAVKSLSDSQERWLALQGWHRLADANAHLAYALSEIGETHRATELAYDARAMARAVGDALTEGIALSMLVKLRDQLPREDPLDLIAQAEALAPVVRRQRGADGDGSWSGGALEVQAATLCADAGAYDLAETYFERAVEAGRELAPSFRYRLVYRLANFVTMLQMAGRVERAAATLEELEREAEGLGGDARVSRAVSRATTRQAFARGDRSAETLSGLLEECGAYEDIRERARAAGSLAGLFEAVDPPYDEAAEVALALGRPRAALALLERGKARTLLEALDVAMPRLADLDTADRETVPAGLALFVTRSELGVLAAGGEAGDVTWHPVADGGVDKLRRALGSLADAADSERGVGLASAPLDAVLGDATFRALCRDLLDLAPTGRATWLAPHRFLHQAPLQLAARAASTSWSILPALSLTPALPARRIDSPGWTLAACGDPTDDLPFARAEARLVARDADLAVGPECDASRLRAQAATEELGILHLACHGRLDRGRPERSGLVLAGPPDLAFPGTTPAALLPVGDLAELPLAGVVVVLSACSTGLEAVREGDEATGLQSALLRAGAAAVVAAQWPIDDLSAMLQMVGFHARVRGGAAPPDLHEALAAGAGQLRDMSAFELSQRGFTLAEELRGLGGGEDEAVAVAAGCLRRALTAMGDTGTVGILEQVIQAGGNVIAGLQSLRPRDDERAEAKPFAHPSHWGAFSIVGRGHG